MISFARDKVVQAVQWNVRMQRCLWDIAAADSVEKLSVSNPRLASFG